MILAEAMTVLAAALGARNTAFALVGGIAVSVRAEARFTRDVDVAVAVTSDAEAEDVARDLTSQGWSMSALVRAGRHRSPGPGKDDPSRRPSGHV
jgi:hypothetical protein